MIEAVWGAVKGSWKERDGVICAVLFFLGKYSFSSPKYPAAQEDRQTDKSGWSYVLALEGEHGERERASLSL